MHLKKKKKKKIFHAYFSHKKFHGKEYKLQLTFFYSLLKKGLYTVTCAKFACIALASRNSENNGADMADTRQINLTRISSV